MSEILEIAMIICFGLSWPVNVYKSYKARTTKGKSILFLCFIFIGYIAGILSKLLNKNSKLHTSFENSIFDESYVVPCTSCHK